MCKRLMVFHLYLQVDLQTAKRAYGRQACLAEKLSHVPVSTLTLQPLCLSVN